MRPFFLEGAYQQRLIATLDKAIHSDVPALVPHIQEQHFRLMKAVVRHLALSAIPTVNVEGLCREWGLGKEKPYSLLDALEGIGVIHIVRRKADRSVSMARAAGLEVLASDDETRADFIVGKRSIEIGGPSKKRKKADLVIRADIEAPAPGVLPLWCVGFWR